MSEASGETGAPPGPRSATVLRRIAGHLRQHDWTTAGIEFLIVILGVFIGLQANAWSDAQNDKRRGEAYVERLILDLERDLVRRGDLVAYYDVVNMSAERTHALLRQPVPDARLLVLSAYRATEYGSAPATRATWDEIVSSGDLALLPRAALDDGLSAYFSDDPALGRGGRLAESAYRRRVRRIIPHALQAAIRESCGDVRNASRQITGFREDCDLGTAEAEIGAAAQALRDDPEILGDLRLLFSDLHGVRQALRGDLVFLEGALAALEGDGRQR